MKKLYLILGIALLFACSDDNTEPPAPVPVEPDEASVELNLTEVQIPRAGGSAEVTVVSNYEDWEVECGETWLSIQKSGNKLILSAAENASLKRNVATVTITVQGEGENNTASATLSVIQNDAALVIGIELPDGAKMTAPVVGQMNCTIDWGDGTVDAIEGYFDGLFTPQPSHIYRKGGTYQIRIAGQMPMMDIGLSFDDIQAGYITEVIQWGNTGLVSMDRALKGCVNLIRIPGDTDGSFTEVTEFSNAFYNCKSLTKIPADLFVNCSKVTTFAFCFQDAGLRAVPAGLFDNCSAAKTFISAFSNCYMNSLPDELFSKCVSVTTFSSVFYRCQLLQSIPENLFKGCENVEKFSYAFRGCPSLTEIPEGLFRFCPLANDFSGVFTMCYSLKTLPEGLFAGNPKAESFGYCFMDCTSLAEIPAGLFSANRAVKSFQGTFRGCLRVSGESPYVVVNGTKVHLYERSKYGGQFIAPDKYEYCFSDCTGLTDYSYMEKNYPEWSNTYLK
ncbi:leucine-rich repeat protein [Odoribacter laneus]|uniref:BACON domain-containing protein n=1 Tax=Odoribacter laneus YIT 12061 TaxID=742817 RepID=H1DEY5_9BACT|nr:leucine-rich repeat protein [Odoribacter laneus]EHP49303.1 hypothetical protein HMPREF9449_00821 [Odoribacter laneus YIT 12061]